MPSPHPLSKHIADIMFNSTQTTVIFTEKNIKKWVVNWLFWLTIFNFDSNSAYGQNLRRDPILQQGLMEGELWLKRESDFDRSGSSDLPKTF